MVVGVGNPGRRRRFYALPQSAKSTTKFAKKLLFLSHFRNNLPVIFPTIRFCIRGPILPRFAALKSPIIFANKYSKLRSRIATPFDCCATVDAHSVPVQANAVAFVPMTVAFVTDKGVHCFPFLVQDNAPRVVPFDQYTRKQDDQSVGGVLPYNAGVFACA